MYILPPSISKKIEGYRWQSFTPPAAGKSRRFRGLICHRRSQLGYRKELAAIDDADARRAEFEHRVAEAYDTARAANAATGGGLDDVIDPAETRAWIANGLRRVPPVPPRIGKKHAFIDTW